MTKEEFEEIFKKGFNKQKIYYEDAENNKSELMCFKCGNQAGLKDENPPKVVCTKGHKEDLTKYTGKYIEMEHDFLNCILNANCEKPIKSDYDS